MRQSGPQNEAGVTQAPVVLMQMTVPAAFDAFSPYMDVIRSCAAVGPSAS